MDKVAAYILIGLIIFVGLLIVFCLWAICKAASDADATVNWEGQKFKKEDSND